MRPQVHLVSLSLTALALAGCSSSQSVVTLSNKARDAVNVMGNAYVADLEQMRSYDARRVEEFNRLVRDYEARRGELAESYVKALEQAKAAAKAQLYQEFDEEVNRLLTHDFWVKLRASMDSRLSAQMITAADNTLAKLAQSKFYPNDRLADTTATLAMRNYANDTAYRYATVESTFAAFAQRVNDERRKFRADTESRFATIQLTNSLANRPKAPELTAEDTAKVIERRIADAQKLRASLDAALSEVHVYLTSSKVPWKDFAEGALKAFVGIAESPHSSGEPTAINLPGADSRGASENRFPALSDLAGEFGAMLGHVNNEAKEGQRNGNNLLASLRDLIEPIVTKAAAPPPQASTQPTPQ